jgi:L-threonylcarbamoyladenylate synthase
VNPAPPPRRPRGHSTEPSRVRKSRAPGGGIRPLPSGPGAEILPTHTPVLFADAVQRAAAVLRVGGLVALPTETVYGLAANALDPAAVAAIFAAKGRPARNPIIVHVADLEMARRCVADWPAAAESLARSFWPGPLTLVLPRAAEIPDVVTAGGGTVGIRWPSHPFIQAVIRECGFPLAAPSANPANRLSPTNADHVRRCLGDRVPLIVDGGQSQVGIESTVLDLTVTPPRVLRPGMIHLESLRAALGGRDVRGADEPDLPTGEPLRSPGRLPAHYAPRAKLVSRSWTGEPALRREVARLHVPLAGVHVVAHTVIPSENDWGRVSVIPRDAEAFARAIYAELHRCDELGARLIVVETPPQGGEWQGIADRLERAAGSGAEGP